MRLKGRALGRVDRHHGGNEMPDSSITQAVIQAADLKSLELLYDYTKFHIGFYLTLSSAFITVASLKKGDGFALELRQYPVCFAMVCFMIAGLAGGVIVSSITQCLGLSSSELPLRCSSTQAFLPQRLGPWDLKWFFGKTWTWIEHTAFWVGILFALGSFKGRASVLAEKEPMDVRIQGNVEVKNVAGAARSSGC
jgi:hypothetical protein